MNDDAMAGLSIFGVILVYLLPALVAGFREHRNASAITVLCILLGWSGVGWIVALVWSFTDGRAADAR